MDIFIDSGGEYVLDYEGDKLRKPKLVIEKKTLYVQQGLENHFFTMFKTEKETREYAQILKKWLADL